MRQIHEVASEIRKLWKKPYFGAVPYIEAMQSLSDKDSMYICDSATNIVIRFLGNATTWRGEDARRIKAELKAIIA
jgi:hypothetical protein